MGKQHETPPEVFQITDAEEALTREQSRRMRKYLIQMGIRIACFIGAFIVWAVAPNPIVVSVLIAAAVVLPYIAVIEVNAGRERGITTNAYIDIEPFAEITNSTSSPDDDNSTSQGDAGTSSPSSKHDPDHHTPNKAITIIIDPKKSQSKPEES